jgi:exodeoxyribonuclease VII large subunit
MPGSDDTQPQGAPDELRDNITPQGTPDNTLTVSELCRRVGAALTDAFPDQVWVQGAISGLSRSNNGHVYFDLVDPEAEAGQSSGAVLPVALFASSRQLVNKILRRSGGVRMHDGIEIRIRGQITYYPPQGRVQLVMSLIDPQFTLGQMAAARQQLLDRLSREGLLHVNHHRRFPALPLRVGLITSDQSAAYHDFVDQLTSTDHPFRITLFDTRVQGLEAAPGVAAAIGLIGERASAGDLDVEVVVVIRGGGARTDLAAFDHEDVARAIALSPLPVIVGVGHETDRSVADEVAHTSVKTPTAAAQVLIEAVAEFDDRLHHAADRIKTLTHLHLERANEHLLACGTRLITTTRRTIERQESALDQLTYRLARAPGRRLERAASAVDIAEVKLGANDPQRALQRGWTITYLAARGRNGHPRLLRTPKEVTVGDRIQTVTAEGSVYSTVTEGPDLTDERAAEAETEHRD